MTQEEGKYKINTQHTHLNEGKKKKNTKRSIDGKLYDNNLKGLNSQSFRKNEEEVTKKKKDNKKNIYEIIKSYKTRCNTKRIY